MSIGKPRFICATFLSVLVFGPARAEDVIPTNTASTPRPVLQMRADTGDSSAMLTLAELDLIASAKTKDTSEAVSWFQRAAEAGNIDAMLMFHDAYAIQLRILPNAMAEAQHWMDMAKAALKESADKGDGTAEFRLAYLCDLSDEGANAIQWYGKAAASGSAEAMEELGFHYGLPRDVPQDAHESVRWLTMAAEHGQVKAMFLLADDYTRGFGVDRDAKEAAAWNDKAEITERAKAVAGDQDAMLDVASHDFHGDWGQGRNVAEGVTLLTRAANAGNFTAATTLNLAYIIGAPVPQDLAKAKYWNGVAAKIGLSLDTYNWPKE